MMTLPVSLDSGYLSHLGLSHNPFPVVPDDTCIFLSGRIEQIVAEIVHGIMTRKGFMMLTGDIGLGKTTISRRIISILEEKGVETALVLHTSLQDAELLREINRDFGIKEPLEPGQQLSLGEQLRQLNRFLLDRNRQKKNCAIIIDDAQNLNQQSLELVRMISNLEGQRQKLVQILLVGQPELARRLDTHELRQLRSRVVISKEATPLNRQELKAYIHFKLNSAGNHGQASVTSWAVNHIYRLTRGNFRQVNLLMDRCLYVVCLQNSRQINFKTVKLAYEDISSGSKYIKFGWLKLAAASISLMAAVGVGWIGLEKKMAPLLAVSEIAPDKSDLKKAALPAKEGIELASQETITSRPITDFLMPFGLTKYAKEFGRALTSGQVEDFSHKLFQATGYQLIGLRDPDELIRKKYGILTFTHDFANSPINYLLWRPPIQITKFYYYYQGNEINYLQSLLARADLYHDRLDQIVGPNLMRALVDFQKLKKLPITGFPDPITLFWLCHFKEKPPIG